MMKRVVALVIVSSLLACRADGDGSAIRSAPAVDTAAPASEALDALDTRTPVPLLPMMAKHQKESMRDHLAAVQEITAALAAKDFVGVEKAAARIGYSETMGQMCSHMGAGAPGFTEQALHFHRTADTIGVAAKMRDEAAVHHALATTLATCTTCHAAFKQRIVDEATWASLTKMSPPTHGH